MTIIEWLSSFVVRFKREAGEDPSPLDVAHNLPKSCSDSDAMTAMVKFMEDNSHETKPDSGRRGIWPLLLH